MERLIPAILAAVCYVPLLLTHRGMVGADTKAYLYLDPSRLIARAPSLWDPNTGMGTVTHQNIGYLLPMGPWYWLGRAAHLPMWVTQRLWIGTLLFLAALGVVYLLSALGLSARAVLVAALGYALTPYLLEYVARISAILMPWAAMPWMVGLVIRGLRRGGWRHPAAFALVVALCGGVNATSLIYAGVAPVLWVVFAVWVVREISFARAWATVLRIAVLTLLTNVWWMAGLAVQAGYGLDVLRYTETVPVVASTATPIEVLRNLGNWYFYGRDAVAAWIQPADLYTRQVWLLAVSYLVPLVAFVSSAVVRWRFKLYFVALIMVGTIIAVGAYPYAHPSLLGAFLKYLANGSSAGLAMRSVGRAVPLISLGTAVLVGTGIDALSRRVTVPRLNAVTAVVIGLIVVNMVPLFTGKIVDDNLQRPEQIPSWWTQAAAFLDQGGSATRALELPGADFSHYRWGTTLDPVTPGLMDRPFVGRELIPMGSPPSADLIRAIDEELQSGILDPSVLGPLSRLMSVGDVVLRSDLQYERFLTPAPQPTWLEFNPPPPGLASPKLFGPPVPLATKVPLVNESSIATPASAPDPPPVAIYGVPGALDIVRTEPVDGPVIIAGDGTGLVDAAASGVLPPAGGPARAPVLYAGDLTASQWQQAMGEGADLVLTDTNRKRAERWGTIQDVEGYTEQAGEQPLVNDPTDAPLPLFPGAGDDAYTVAEERGVAQVRATGYGNPVSYEPWYRPDLALDGNPNTAWEVAAFSNPVGQALQIDLAAPVTADHVTLVQPLVGAKERWITKATLTFDGGRPVTVNLQDSSRTAAGQIVNFPTRTFSQLTVTIDGINFGVRADYSGGSPVGFSEVSIPGVQVNEFVRLPTDLLDAAGAASTDHRLIILLSRKRSDPIDSYKSDEEQALARTFSLPAGRTFDLGGQARLSMLAPLSVIDSLIGRPATADGGIVMQASSSMAGTLLAAPDAALDGDPTTAWTSDLRLPALGQWLEADLPAPQTIDHLDLQLVADGSHSVPTQIRVDVGNASQLVNLPAVKDGPKGNVVTVPVNFAAATGDRVRVTVLAVRAVKTLNYFSKTAEVLPVGVAELGLPNDLVSAPPAALDGACRTDLLTVDGQPVGIKITGSTADALAGRPLDVSLCGPPLDLGPGSHDLKAQPGLGTGINLDSLTLGSAAGGQPLTLLPGGQVPPQTSDIPGSTAASPAVKILSQGRTNLRLSLNRTSQPFWLVLGESNNSGWTATINGHALGAPRTVDGYANGWLVTPAQFGGGQGPVTAVLDWTPEHNVRIALYISGAAILFCLLIVGLARDRWPISTGGGGPEGLAPDWTGGLPRRPALARPWSSAGTDLSRRGRVLATVAATVIAGLVITPIAGLLVGAATAAVMWRPRWRGLLPIGAVIAVGISSLYIIELQFRYRFPAKLDWPQHFAKVVSLTWVGIVLFGVDALVEWLRNRPRPSS